MWEISNDGFVRTLTLSRPEAMNALSPSLIDELINHLEQIAEDDSVRVVVFTGKGNVFRAGMDVGALANPEDPENTRMFNQSVPTMFEAFIDFPKPIIMAVNGLGVGWGATVLSHADMVIMAESARLKCPFASLAEIPEAASTDAFPRMMSHQQAYWLLMSNEWMSAEQCKQAGLALDVVADEELMAAVMKRAHTLAAFPTVSLVETKRLIKAPYRDRLLEANRAEMERFRELLQHPACKEGLAAIREKRPADFSAF